MPGQMPGRRLHAQDRQATGNPVYNGASNAATMGTVDPSGYVDRERRSGLAAAMMGRRSGAKGQPEMLTTAPSQVGETASRMDRREVIRRLAQRMSGQEA
jgi:hypothetical protein